MKKNLLIIFAAILFATFLNTSKAQTFHMDALDAYWKMIEPLKKGDSLSHETWNQFLNIEANKIYTDNQGFNKEYLERLRKSIEVVYMPQNAEILQKRVIAIEKDPASFWLTYKVYVYKKNEKVLRDFQSKLNSKKYIETSYQKTFKMLPKRLQIKDKNITIYPLGIENDAIAGNGTVIVTLWTLYNADKIELGALLGHEMHHVLRKPLYFKNIEKQDEGLMYFIKVVLNEGSADMIDKPSNLASENILPYALCYKDFLIPQADSIIGVANKNILEMQVSNGRTFKMEKEYRKLVQYTSGHKPGYFMADVILRNGYKNQLLKNIQNPFKFIYLYNKAAKKDKKNPPLFAKESIKYIQMMEKKYWSHKEN